MSWNKINNLTICTVQQKKVKTILNLNVTVLIVATCWERSTVLFDRHMCRDVFGCSNNFNPLNAELNLICCLLALLGAHQFLHVSRIRVKSLTLRLVISYIYIYIYIYIF